MDIEAILEMYEDDYNPSSKVPGPRNMYNQGQLVQPNADGSRPGYSGDRDRTTKLKNFIGKKKKIKKTEIIKLLNDLEYPNWSTQLAKLKERGYFDNVEIIDDFKQTRDTLKGGGSRISQVEDIFANWKSKGKTNYTKQELIEALPEGAYKKNKAAYDSAENKIKKNYKSIKFLEQNIDRSKPLPKSVQQKLVEAFPEIDFKFGTKAQSGYGIRKYGVSKKDVGEALYGEIQAFAKYNLEPQFPKGTTPESKLLFSMFRSTQSGSGGGVKFQLVDKNGKVIPKEKYPKNWRKNQAFKNIRILDTETGDIIKYTDDIKGKGISMKDYINKVEKNPQAYNQALESYKLQKNIGTTTYMYKGKEYTLGGTLNKNRVIENFKKEFKRNPTKDEMKNLFRSNNVGSWQVHHPEGVANNWWKSEVAFRDANMKLNYIDRNLKASLKTINNPGEKAKLIKQVSTEVKKLPGGISYIFEGQELGKPSDLKSVMKAPISQANLKAGERKAMEKAMLEFAGTISKKCNIDFNADGGRIGFKTGSADCLRIAKEGLEKNLFKGGGTEVQRGLIQKIISGGGKMAISMLNPKELIKLKNLVGPGALGLMGAYEVGSITDDVLRLNKPLDEALAGNWLTKSFLPYSEEFAKQKNLLQSGQLTGDQRDYALEMMKMENFIKEGQRIEGLEANKLVEGTLDDNFTFTSDKDMNKAYSDLFGRFSRLKPYAYEQGITGRSLENEAAMNEYIDAQTARTGASKVFGGPQPMVNKASRPKNMTRGPMTEKGKMNLDFSIPGYTSYDKAYNPSNEEILQIYRNQGIVPATFGGKLQPGEGTKVRMGLASQGDNRSIYGSKFMEGGIASLNVNKK